MEVGPDGLLYYPLMTANEIWRIDPDGGEPQRVAGDLGVPDAVKFDSEGFIVSTQVASGQVLRIDPRSGEQTLLAQLNPGLDNLTFVGDRLFVSNFTGEITEILRRRRDPHRAARRAELAAGSGGGRRRQPLRRRRHLLLRRARRRVAADRRDAVLARAIPASCAVWPPAGPGEFVVTTSGGQIARYRPGDGETDYLADGFDQLYGVAIGPDDTIVFAELGTGRVHSLRSGNVEVLASGLQDPVGVAFDPDGSAAGRRIRRGPGGPARPGRAPRPWSTACSGRRASSSRDGTLYIVDAGAKEVVAFDLTSGDAHAPSPPGLPVGPPPGVEPKPLKGMPPFSGPQGPFAGITAGPDGTLYVSADGDGSVLALRRADT